MKKPKSKLYRAFRYTLLSLAAAYLLLLIFPQVLFAHEVNYKNFTSIRASHLIKMFTLFSIKWSNDSQRLR